jgi:midasin (ATPase involved in ribosome maturation)
MDTGHWLIEEGLYLHENMFGFIYEITNKANGKKYIGKKQCIRKIKRKPLKGKTRNRIDHKESDWKTYTSSSNELNEDIKKYGKEIFEFRILRVCGSKWELGYEEIKEQISRDVLRRDDYYNGIINVRIGTPPKSLLNNT